MRKIEKQMNSAIWSKTNWSNSNTSVITEDDGGTIGAESHVYLHGNHIATYTHKIKELQLFDGGWQSNTTKSRLNALCDAFCIAGEGIFQSDFVWYVRKFTGQIGAEKVFTTEMFSNGYVFA